MKFLIGLATSLVLALGLLVAPSSVVAANSANSANAAACTYAPTVHTFIAAGRVAPAVFRFSVNAGERHPSASVWITIIRVSNGNVVRRLHKSYAGGVAKYYVGPLRRGRYTAKFFANPYACKYFSSRKSITFFKG